jgi:2-polyprenyl-6-methoxyphenol hydroxylase-like FAD-dependent oxidoreductase
VPSAEGRSATYSWANLRNLLSPSNLDLHLSSEFIALEDKEDGFIESQFSCEEKGMEKKIHTVRSRVFVGADGIHSGVSKFLKGPNAIPTGVRISIYCLAIHLLFSLLSYLSHDS